jgi:hypothetical protein
MEAEFSTFLRLAVLLFWVRLPLVQWLVFAELGRRGRDPALLRGKSVRDHVLGSLLRAGRVGVVVVLAAFATWALVPLSPGGFDLLLDGEILFAFLVLELGLAALAVRLGLRVAQSPTGARRALLGLRAGTLALGWIYGAALWILVPGGRGETLFSVFVLGAALIILGLNRASVVSAEAMSRLGHWMGRGS